MAVAAQLSSRTKMQVSQGSVKLWEEAGNSNLHAQFTLADGSHVHFLGHFNPAVEEFKCHDATLQYANREALTASHKFHGKIGTRTIVIAIGSDDGPVVDGQLFRPLSPASRIVGFGSWYESLNEGLSTILAGIQRLEGNTARIRNDQGSLHAPQWASQLTAATVLRDLKAVSSAVFNAQQSKGCLENTRVNILEDLAQWARDTTAPSIFWLTGMAGTGKTSIALSFCKRLADEADLGGSFFCSRTAATVEQTEVRRVVPTLARLLARQNAAFEAAIIAQLTAEPDITDLTVGIQVERLLRKTLAKLPSRYGVPLVLVIDALDEYSNSEATADLIHALIGLTQDWALMPFPVKFLVTSRPEPHIRRRLGRFDPRNIMVLHEIDPEEVSSDIYRYVETTFAATPMDPTSETQSSNATWYSSSDIASITTRSNGLFIFASTAVKFILEKGHAAGRAKRLHDVVNQAASPLGTTVPLDRMYELILRQGLLSFEMDERIDLQLLLAQLLALREPLSVRGFAELVRISIDELRSVLETLHSVINVPADNDLGDLRTLHASFGDFLQHRAPETFQADIDRGRELLLHACLGRMQAKDLCFNVSRSASSYQRNPPARPLYIPRSLEYACLHWAFHLGEVTNPAQFEPNVKAVFVPKFLFWLEVVSVLRRVDDGLRALAFAESWVSSNEVNQFLRDFREFVTFSLDAIEAQVRGRARSVATVLRGHESAVSSLACSPDKHFLVSGSIDKTVRIWDVRTGRQAHPAFTGHKGSINAVAFSPDGLQVVSGSDDKTLRIWDILTRKSAVVQCGSSANAVAVSPDGSLLAAGLMDDSVRIWSTQTRLEESQLLRGHSDWVWSVAFSPDGQTLASASEDGTIRLWDIETGQQVLGSLTSGDGGVRIVSFSPDGRSLVSGSENSTMRTWAVLTGEKRRAFEEYTDLVWSVSFSPDGTRIASGSSDCVVRVWNAKTEQVICALTGHAGSVRAVSFFHAETVASASDDGTICVWDLRNSQQRLAPLAAHSGAVFSAAMSADGAWIVSGSNDKTVRVWHSDTGDQKLPPIQVGNIIRAVSFPSDGTRIAAGGNDNCVQIFDARTGRKTQSLQGHENAISSVSFSPDGEQLLSASWDKTVCVWTTQKGTAGFEA